MPERYHLTGRTARDIATDIEQRITAGELHPGADLPPIRTLAADLEVNHNTVSAAYRRLRERGVTESHGRRGTRVRQRPATTPRSFPGTPLPDGVRNLADGGPDPRLLPVLTHPDITGSPPVGYEDSHLEPRLVELARLALASDGVPADRLTLTSGALDGVERVLTVHLRPGDRVAVEDPGWSNLLDLVAALGLAPVPVTLDDEGMDPDRLRHVLDAGARAVVLTSRAQNPTGAAVSAERAAGLAQVLSGYPGVLVVEDDHAAGVAGAGVQTLAARTEHWAHLRSVAKAYGPDLRLAVVTGDATTVERVAGRLRLGPGWVSHLLQRTVVDLWQDRLTAQRVTTACEAYTRRRRAVVAALAERDVRAHGRSGLNVWVPVPDETAAVARLLAAGWAVTPGMPYRLTSPPAVRISIAALDEGDAPDLAAAVAAATSRSASVSR